MQSCIKLVGQVMSEEQLPQSFGSVVPVALSALTMIDLAKWNQLAKVVARSNKANDTFPTDPQDMLDHCQQTRFMLYS
eukprot:6471524-Amphidinium_carterae.1